MEFSLFGTNIIIQRSKNKSFLSQDDIDNINNETLKYIKNLSLEEIDNRIKNIICNTSENVGAVKKTLSEMGIVVIPNFIDQNSINNILKDLNEIKESVQEFKSKDQLEFETQDVLYQKGSSKVKGYKNLSNYNKSIVLIRQGQDEGMVEIFNVDKFKKSFKNSLKPYFNKKIISELVNNDLNVKPKNLNLYLNSNILKTRGFHVDSYNKQIKAFIYLEDCVKLENGPYTYVTKSNISSSMTNINRQISSGLPNKTETPFVNPNNIVPVLAKKGTLVISDQGGYHRGLPQSYGNHRTVAVMNFS